MNPVPKKAPKKILIVDDDAGMVKLLDKWLKVAGYETAAAFDGYTAVDKVVSEKPDLILLDVLLPDLNGTDVVKKLKVIPEAAGIPIVFMTVCINQEDDKGEEKIGVEGKQYPAFAKPLHNPKLLAIIRKEINKKVHGNQ